MSVLGQHKLYDFRKQSWQEVQDGLVGLISAKETMVAKGPEYKKIYNYIELVNSEAEKDIKDNLDLIDKEIMMFLDAELMQEFLVNPEDNETLTALSLQFAFVAAATGSMQGVNPYSKDELRIILQGEGSFYTDVNFLYTLRTLIAENADLETGRLLLNTLVVARVPSEDINKKYFWDEALILSLLLQSSWRFFSLFDSTEKQFLIQNYFYKSVVLGVPIRFWLQDFLSGKDYVSVLGISQTFVSDLQKNREYIPLNSEDESGKSLADVLIRAVLRAYSEGIDILELEKFINEIYQVQEDGPIYASWLREVLTTVLHLKKGDILEVLD